MGMNHMKDVVTYDPSTTASMKSLLKPGMCVYDIGAYDGITSVILANIVGPENVAIIEPAEMNWATIHAFWNAHGFGAPWATYAGFLADSNKDKLVPGDVVYRRRFPPEVRQFPVAQWEEGLNFRVLEYRDLYPEVAARPQLTLDTLAIVIGKPQGIAIDVEGAELLVLHGAEYTLRVYSPIVWVSIHPEHMRKHFNQEPDDLHQYMKSLGYNGTLLVKDHEEHWVFQPSEVR